MLEPAPSFAGAILPMPSSPRVRCKCLVRHSHGIVFGCALWRRTEVICDRATALEILHAAAAIEHVPQSRQGWQQPMSGPMRQKRSAPRRIRFERTAAAALSV